MPMVFPLAPMTTNLRVLTWICLAIPAVLLWAALAWPSPESATLLVVVGLLALTYASVWFVWRPTRFEVDAAALRIVWPVRARSIARRSVTATRIVTACELRDDYGNGMRIGAGGLWGGFGLLKTRKATFSMWISRTDRLVVVELRDARPLLLTPDEPERFVDALRG